MKRYLKTGLTDLLYHHLGHRAFAAPLVALFCAAGAGSCLAAKILPPTAQNLSVVAAANLFTPIVLEGSDPNGLALTFTIVSPPTQGTLSGKAPNVVYTPRPDFVGADSFSYKVSDGKATSNPATVSIAVKVGLSINNISVIEGDSGTTPATFTVTPTASPGLLGLHFSYRTIDGTAVGSGLPIVTGADYLAASQTVLTGGTQTPVTVLVLGDTRVEPDETFSVELFNPSDNAVILNGIGRCTILNDDRLIQPPTAVDLSVVAVANRSVPVVLEGTDPQNLSLTFSIVSGPSQGTLSGTAPNLIYQPRLDFLGPDSFSYTVSNGQATSAPATASITVKNGIEIDDLSVTEGNSGTTTAIFSVSLTARPSFQGVTFSYRTIDGTAVSSGPDADYVAATQTVLATTRKTPITVQVLGDTVVEPDETFFVELFNPSADAVILKGLGRCTILNDDPTPTAFGLSIVAAANRSTPIVLQGSDPQGLPLTFSIVSGPSHGTLTALSSSSSSTPPDQFYSPALDYLGPDSFSYVVNNGLFTSAPATVGITVKKGLEINNISVTKPTSGTKSATFTVTMTAPGSELDLVLVSFRTVDGTAHAGTDYVATSGNLIFAANTVGTVPVTINGGLGNIFDETFLVELFNASANAVIVNGSGRCTIISGSVSRVGTAALDPENSVASAGEPVGLRLAWTHPVGWRHLASVDLLLLDDEGESLVVRWHVAENSFSLFNPAAGAFVRTAEAGSPARFETSAVTMYLRECTGGGPPGHTATIDFGLSFKPQAAGRTFSVEAFATDDAGNQQGFESVGTLTLLPR